MFDRKMAIFGYQRVRYPIFRQRLRIENKEKLFCKALVISFSEKYKTIYIN